MTYLQTEVSRIFPNAQPGSGQYNKRRYVKALRGGGRGWRGGRGGCGGRGGRGGRGGGRGDSGDKMENGVDISDPTRWYTSDQLTALSAKTRNYILNHKDRPAAIAERKRKRDAGENNTSSAETGNRNRAELITALANATRTAAAVDNRSRGAIRLPQNGNNNRQATSVNTNPPTQVSTNSPDSASVLTFDHLGNIVE